MDARPAQGARVYLKAAPGASRARLLLHCSPAAGDLPWAFRGRGSGGACPQPTRAQHSVRGCCPSVRPCHRGGRCVCSCVHTCSGTAGPSACLGAKLHSCRRLRWAHPSRAAHKAPSSVHCWDSLHLLWAVAAGPGEQGDGVSRVGRQSPRRAGNLPVGTPSWSPGFSGEASLGLALGPFAACGLRLPWPPGCRGPGAGLLLGTSQRLAIVDLGQLFPYTYFSGVSLPTTTVLHLKCYLLPPSLVPPQGCGEAQPSPWCSQGYGDKSRGIVTSIRSKLAGRFRAGGKIICCSISNGLEMDLKGKFMPPITKARKRTVLGTAPSLAFIIHA